MQSALAFVNHLNDVIAALPAAPRDPTPAPSTGGGGNIPFMSSDNVKALALGLIVVAGFVSSVILAFGHRKQNIKGAAEKGGTFALSLIPAVLGLSIAAVMAAATGTLNFLLPGH